MIEESEMLDLVPTHIFLTKGVGRHKYQLKSFEVALRQAGVVLCKNSSDSQIDLFAKLGK